MQDQELTVLHSVDFDKPGVYIVELKRYYTTIDKFPIQVIELPKVVEEP